MISALQAPSKYLVHKDYVKNMQSNTTLSEDKASIIWERVKKSTNLKEHDDKHLFETGNEIIVYYPYIG